MVFRRSLALCSTAALRSVCVVGAGPAGFYTTDSVLKGVEGARVTLLERLAVPFGLVRFGVAPDHAEVKAVENKFNELLHDPRVEFLGNVRVGKDVAVNELLDLYDAVVLACGAESDLPLNLPGESAANVFSARDFVGWYNGHPDFVQLPVDLRDTEDAVVIGNGNVALDIARILLRCPADLRSSDIATYALHELEHSKLRRIHVLGRRGVAQASWTAKELREVLFAVRDTAPRLRPASSLVLSDVDREELRGDRSRRRCVELFERAVAAGRTEERAKRELVFHFLRTPTSFQVDAANGRVCGVRTVRNVLAGPAGRQRAMAAADARDGSGQDGVEEEDGGGGGGPGDLPAGLVVKSVGYRSIPIEGVPFDRRRGVVPNVGGKVDGEERLFVSGWLKRGPSGIIGTNKWDAEETIQTLVAGGGPSASTASDAAAAAAAAAPRRRSSRGGCLGLRGLLSERGVPIVESKGWDRIDEEERRRGSLAGTPREKITDQDTLLALATGTS